MEMAGKTALITGCAKRIGREIALTLARRGASILIHYHNSRKDALQLQKEIRSLGSEAWLVRAGFSGTQKSLLPSLKRFIQEIYDRVPRVDILVNNAAAFYPLPFEKISERDWDNYMEVNLKVPFFLAQQIGLRMFKQKSGKIINLVDNVGFRPRVRFIPYAVSKAGLISATLGLAKALAPYVQVNGVAPGPILPPPGGMKASEKSKAAKKTLLGHFGDPRDIAGAVRFLVEDGDYMTGAIIPVDGGSFLT